MIGRDLRDRVIERLGLPAAPAPDRRGLEVLYAAWCANVPFDNVRKMTALLTGGERPLPGRQAAEFFEAWLSHGAGGTCWPTSNALFELAASLGFAARRIVGCMRDLGVVNHASLRIDLEGSAWLADSSMLTNIPLPLNREVFTSGDPVFAVEVEPDGATHVVWWDLPPNQAYLPCRIAPDAVDHARYLDAYERSREQSPFNQRLYARRNRPGELIVLLGNTRFARSAAGIEARELSAAALRGALSEDFGISEALIEEWVRAGGLTATLTAPAGPKPPPVLGRPPSQR